MCSLLLEVIAARYINRTRISAQILRRSSELKLEIFTPRWKAENLGNEKTCMSLMGHRNIGHGILKLPGSKSVKDAAALGSSFLPNAVNRDHYCHSRTLTHIIMWYYMGA